MNNLKKDIQALEKGKDISETKKILIVIHLLKCKTPTRKICKIFSKLPDYNEAMLRHQIKWLSSSPEMLA
jgi:hypothetical protein